MCRSHARSIEVGVLGQNTGRGWRRNVCRSHARSIEVGSRARTLGGGGGGMRVVHMPDLFEVSAEVCIYLKLSI